MDITFLIMCNAILFSSKKAYQYIDGDIIDLWESSKYSSFDEAGYNHPGSLKHPHFRYIHVTGFPIILTLQTIKETLLSQSVNGVTPIRKRSWKIIDLPASYNSTLITSGQVTIPYSDAKILFRRKLIINKLDSSLDDISHSLLDSDF